MYNIYIIIILFIYKYILFLIFFIHFYLIFSTFVPFHRLLHIDDKINDKN